MTTPDLPAADWRDLVDELTAEQHDRLADREARRADGATDRLLLLEAREYATDNVIAAVNFGHLDQPDGTVPTGPARQNMNGDWYRSFVSTECYSLLCSLSIHVTQFDDGRVDHSARFGLYEAEEEVTYYSADDAREIARDLVEIADELDRRDKWFESATEGRG